MIVELKKIICLNPVGNRDDILDWFFVLLLPNISLIEGKDWQLTFGINPISGGFLM